MNALNVFVVDFKQILSVLVGAFNHTQNTKFIIGFPNIFTSSIIPIVSFFLEKHVHQQCLKAFFLQGYQVWVLFKSSNKTSRQRH